MRPKKREAIRAKKSSAVSSSDLGAISVDSRSLLFSVLPARTPPTSIRDRGSPSQCMPPLARKAERAERATAMHAKEGRAPSPRSGAAAAASKRPAAAEVATRGKSSVVFRARIPPGRQHRVSRHSSAEACCGAWRPLRQRTSALEAGFD